MKNSRTAVLITCYNRKETTIKCLKTLFDQDFPDNLEMEVFLVDDASPDGTGSAVRKIFPQVHVINGTGDLYWGGGMRLAWEKAVFFSNSFDFYFWLNDDVELLPNAIKILITDWRQILDKTKKDALISGCVRSPSTGKTSYSGHAKKNLVDPTGYPQPIRQNNGNAVLISKKIYNTIGNISSNFKHQQGDSDYGLRCLKNGFGCYVSSHYVGECEHNDKPTWDNPNIPLLKRLALLHAPTGMRPRDWFVFCLRHEGIWSALTSIPKLYTRALFPKLYLSLKNTLNFIISGEK